MATTREATERQAQAIERLASAERARASLVGLDAWKKAEFKREAERLEKLARNIRGGN